MPPASDPLHQPFLRVPPFPGARMERLWATPIDPTGANLDHFRDLLAASRVGGSYWGSVRPADKCDGEIRLTANDALDPWTWIEGADRCHLAAGADDAALVAMLLDKPVAGPWLDGGGSFDALLTKNLLGWQYHDPFSGRPITVPEAIALCAYWRKLIDANRKLDGSLGIGFWKRETVDPLLWAGTDPVPSAIATHVAVWKSRADPKALAKVPEDRIAEVEDGFIRSVGLGADCVPPLSIVVDFQGIYFDPSRPSDLEVLLGTADFDPALLKRASALRQTLVAQGISKYGGGSTSDAVAGRRPGYLLVVGQVEDDRSIQLGTSSIRTNLALLQRVRDEHPDAIIVYRPHPDVEAGHRIGRIEPTVVAQWADEIADKEPITSLIANAGEVHVMTSLAGFEALLRDKPVTTYGAPFYAGWGLTRDYGDTPSRRKRIRTIDDLVAAALLLYPRYLDPVTRIPCPPELLVERLTTAAPDRPSWLTRLRRGQGKLRRWLS